MAQSCSNLEFVQYLQVSLSEVVYPRYPGEDLHHLSQMTKQPCGGDDDGDDGGGGGGGGGGECDVYVCGVCEAFTD